MLHHNSVLATIDPPRCIPEVGRNAPQRHKQPAPFRQAVITRRWLSTLPTAPSDPAMCLHSDLDRLRPPLAANQTHLPVDEAHKMLHAIQNRLNLQLNSWSPLGLCFLDNCRLTQRRGPAIHRFLQFLGRPRWRVGGEYQEAARRPPSTPGLSRRSSRIPALLYPPIKPLHFIGTGA